MANSQLAPFIRRAIESHLLSAIASGVKEDGTAASARDLS